MAKPPNIWKSVSESHITPLHQIYTDHYHSRTIHLVRLDAFDRSWWDKYGTLVEPVSEFGVIYRTWAIMLSVMSTYHAIEFMVEGILDTRKKFDKWDEMD